MHPGNSKATARRYLNRKPTAAPARFSKRQRGAALKTPEPRILQRHGSPDTRPETGCAQPTLNRSAGLLFEDGRPAARPAAVDPGAAPAPSQFKSDAPLSPRRREPRRRRERILARITPAAVGPVANTASTMGSRATGRRSWRRRWTPLPTAPSGPRRTPTSSSDDDLLEATFPPTAR